MSVTCRRQRRAGAPRQAARRSARPLQEQQPQRQAPQRELLQSPWRALAEPGSAHRPPAQGRGGLRQQWWEPTGSSRGFQGSATRYPPWITMRWRGIRSVQMPVDFDPLIASRNDGFGKADEKTVFDDAGYGAEPRRQFVGYRNCAKSAIEQIISAVTG